MERITAVMNRVSPLWGVCDFAPFAEHILPCRAAKRIPDGAQSILVALFPYYLGEDAYEDSNISRYAVVPDYNDFLRDMLCEAAAELSELVPNEQFAAFCGNSPLPEVAAAVKAGLGTRGRNGLLLTERYGSWVFIGEIVTTLHLTPAEKELQLCDSCDLCIRACPTGALSESGFDDTLCLSAITQQKKPLTPQQEEMIRQTGCAWGCDICQKACPKNKGVMTTEIELFLNGVKTRAEHGEDLEGRAYGWRGAKVIERNLDILDGGSHEVSHSDRE